MIHAKNNHIAGTSVSAGERKSHTDPRFYSWSSDLVNSIHAEKVKVFVNGLKGEVTAGEKYATKIEIGGPNSRAFPFMVPAITGTSIPVIALFAAAVKKVIK